MHTQDNNADGDKADDSGDRVRFFLEEISSSRREQRRASWEEQCEDAWREYQCQDLTKGAFRRGAVYEANNYNRYASDTNIMLSALYTDADPVANRKFDRDDTSQTASIIMERVAAYIIENSCFEETIKSADLSYLNTSCGQARVYSMTDVVVRAKRKELEEIPSLDPETGESTTAYVDDQGEAPPEDAIVQQDSDGTYFYEIEDAEEEVENPSIYTSSLHYDEYLINKGARRQSDVWLMMFKLRCPRSEAVEMFGLEKVLKHFSGVDGDSKTANAKVTDDRNIFEYWECWDKKTLKVYWLSQHCSDEFLKEEKDPYGLRGFFPCPLPMLINSHYNDLYPTPDFSLTRDLYENLHLYMLRINILLKCIKSPLLIDGSNEDLAKLVESVDGEYFAIKNLKDLVNGDGGLQSLILIPDFTPIANTLSTVVNEFMRTMELIDQLRGTSDIVRGGEGPANQTAEAARFQRASANNRFSWRVKETMRFRRDLLEIALDLAFKTFPADEIKRIAGYAYMDQDDQNRFDAALLLCKDDKSRVVRIQFETNETDAISMQDRQAQAQTLLSSVSQFIIPALQAIQGMPPLQPLMFKVLEIAIDKFNNGKHVSDELKQVFSTLKDQMEAAAQPPPDPGPDIETQKLQFAQQKAQMDYQMEQQQLQMASMKQQFQQFMEQQKLQLDQRKQWFAEQIGTAESNLNYQTAEAELENKARDNARLEQEEMMEMQRGPELPKPPAVVINMPQPQPVVQQVPMMPPTFGLPDFQGF